MQTLDYAIIAVYFLISFSIVLYYYKRASKDINEFFLSGRNLPWYLAGLSMVATTFAADTPLAVTELVTKNGIAGNWLWWNFAFGGMLTVFFFAKLWRRAGIMTEVEFAEIRYSGKPAKFLRGFRALYLGLFMNLIIMGWVNKAMAAILTGMFGIPESEVLFYVFGCMIMVAVYSAISGLWGVVVTDAFQFFIAMGGSILLAVFVLSSSKIGGITGLQDKLPKFVFDFFPNITNVSSLGGAFSLTIASFLAYIGIIWWASWYPGAEPGGGGYVAQRMMSAKDEKHSLFATLFFQITHYAVRPWPWILVGLCTLVLYPDLAVDNKGIGYVYAMRDFLPVGIKGFLVAAFFAAYMSTIATQLNWGTSYLINDFYKRFIKKDKEEKHYINVSRIATILLMIISVFVTLFISRISGAWQFIMECGAGLGSVLILRWFWWRINAWSEISAMITPFVVYPIVKYYGIEFPNTLFYLVTITTIVWIIVTFLTKPTDEKTLISFYTKNHPGGFLWKKISKKLPYVEGDSGFLQMFVNWFAGVVLVYSMLLGSGSLIFGDIKMFFTYLLIAIICTAIIIYNLSKIGWSKIIK
ncbi:MAG: sodium:proline symporter [Ignavibacteriales bacterium CG_4_9_14_3_um_filter_30_11]|nr:MAG: sodium:proline symporter [Ignavibacteriales bacterium CG_4_9_14_3_um_filter_30_11]